MQMITLKINYQRKAEKFLGRNQAKITTDEVRGLIVKAVRRLTGKNENIDLVKMKGEFDGYFRIRKNNLRIIFNVYEDDKEIVVTVVDVDFRGSIYK
ncbi:MAG: hypothetical protein FD188_143 [Ignavibacteria bacterium]|nr:MAG: hypothetical protein FD188_143 [Ignavibacteria bacterium]